MAERPRAPAEDAAEEEIAEALALLRRSAPDGLEQLIRLVYAELRRVAHRQLAAEPAGHTLSTTALVHEAYLRLTDQRSAVCGNRAQFFGIAAQAMRRVLVDYARRHHAVRRGGPRKRSVSLEEAETGGDAGALAVASRSDELLALDEALGVSKRTVASDWLMAKGWLYRELRSEDG